jgi:hypothetical protein
MGWQNSLSDNTNVPNLDEVVINTPDLQRETQFYLFGAEVRPRNMVKKI